MHATPDPVLVFTNCPSEEVADRIATHLIEAGLAACVNRLAPALSTYRWQGAVARETEWPLLIKTAAPRYADVQAAICALHPYDVPEIVAVAVHAGLPAYVEWIAAVTRRDADTRA